MIDLTGQRFGKLIAKGYTGKSRWDCICDCGGTKNARADSLKDGNVTSCGCKRTSFKDLAGMQFGRLRVIEEVEEMRIRSSTCWKCECECGNIKIAASRSLISGGTSSCGCYAKDMTKLAKTTHGHSAHPLYNVWKKMVNRCMNPIDAAYKYYGDRGIKVCDRWKDVNYFILDMAQGYSSELYLDRVDVNGDYEPDNCRWVDASVSAYNRRKLKGKSQYHGVYLHPINQKWIAYMTIEGKHTYLGSFDGEEDAAKVYDAESKRVYKQDAKLNFK